MSDTSDCPHQEVRVETTVYADKWGVEHWENNYVTESWLQDLDLHHYHCTRCGKVWCYSGKLPND